MTETVGQWTDAELAALKALAAKEEAHAKSFITKQLAWLKANWPHLITWVTSGVVALKVFGKL